MKNFVIDVETDGKLQGINSIVCFGCVSIENPDIFFYGKVKPISDSYDETALSISGFTREEHLEFDDPVEVFTAFYNFIKENSKSRPIFWSDNNGFDFAWIAWYFIYFLNDCPFGWSSRRVGDLICGAENDLFFKWKHFGITEHNHNPVDDAKRVVEAIHYFNNKHKLGFKIKNYVGK